MNFNSYASLAVFLNSWFVLFCFWTRNLISVNECWLCSPNLTERENLQNSDCPFRLLFEDFRLCLCYNNVTLLKSCFIFIQFHTRFRIRFRIGSQIFECFLGKYLATLIWGNLHKNFMKMWVTQLCYANVTKVCHASQGNLSAVDHTNAYDKMWWNRKAILHVLQIFITISVSQLQFYLVTKPEQVNLSWGLFKTNS